MYLILYVEHDLFLNTQVEKIKRKKIANGFKNNMYDFVLKYSSEPQIRNVLYLYIGAKDWTWLYDCVPEKLRTLHNSGHRIVFVTNQAGIEKMKAKPEEIMTKINDIINQLNIPCFVSVRLKELHVIYMGINTYLNAI